MNSKKNQKQVQSHSTEWLKEAGEKVALKPGLLKTMKDVFGFDKNQILDVFYDKDQNGDFYKRPARFDLDQTQLQKLQDLNDSNRHVNSGYIIHKENLLNGTFHLTPDPIMINQDGKMVNGGHRTKGGVKAGVDSMPMMVVVNTTEEENLAYDQGKKRTNTAITKMFSNESINSDPRLLPFCYMASTLGYMGASRQSVGITNAKYYLEQNSERILSFFEFFDSFGQSDELNKRSLHRALYLIMHNEHGVDGKDFIKRFFTENKVDDDLTTLRNSIKKKLLTSDPEIIKKTLLLFYHDSGLNLKNKKGKGLNEKEIPRCFAEENPVMKSEAKAS